MFLYSDPGLFYKAYFIIPDSTGTTIQHQYGCVGCQQFEITGRIEKVSPDLAKKFTALLGDCHYASPEVLSLETGLNVKDVLGEGLAQLQDGRFIAVENCD